MSSFYIPQTIIVDLCQLPMLIICLCCLLLLILSSEAPKTLYCSSYLPTPQQLLRIPEPRVYPFVNGCSKESHYEQYSTALMKQLKYPDKRYRLIEFVEEGGSGDVFLAVDKDSGKKAFLKQLKARQKEELKYNLNSVYFQELLDQSAFISKPIEVLRHKNRRVTLVYPYKKALPFRLGRRILRQLLKALDYAHSNGIMHRDIKPGNILVHPGPHARLIDWNLASLYFFSKQNEVELGTLCYMSPEMLIGYPYYHYSIDIWGLGSAMLEWYYGIRLKGDTQQQVLDSVAWLLGGASLNDFIHKYRIKPTQATLKIVAKKYPGGGLRRLKPVRKVSHKLRDLMEKMLTFDHNDRIMASEALAHPYFQSKSVKNK